MDRSNIKNKISNISFPFIENRGQYPHDVLFKAQTFTGSFFIKKTGEMVYNLTKYETIKTKKEKVHFFQDNIPHITGGVVLNEILLNANISNILPEEKSITKVSYFKGKDNSQWKKEIKTYNKITYGEIYPYIELELKSYGNNIEKLFYIKPGGKIESIRIKIEGINNLRINSKGQLVIDTDLGKIQFSKPKAFYLDNLKPIKVSYKIYNKNEYGFLIETYDTTKTVVIDPLLASTFFGGSGNADYIYAIDINSTGDIYIAGYTNSSDFPVTTGVYDTTYNSGAYDTFVAKFNNSLTSLLAFTYIGGDSTEYAKSLLIDSSGNVFIAGYTYISTTPFPTTAGAYDETHNGLFDAFIAKFDSDLDNLLASTFIGDTGNDCVTNCHIEIDNSGNIYITGYTDSNNFPTTAGVYDNTYNGSKDSFVAKLDNNLSTLLASTYIGGSSDDFASAIAIDSVGNVYITGFTNSNNFPTIIGSYDVGYNYGTDIFISKFDSNLQNLLASTYLGDTGTDYVYDIEIDNSGNIYITGFTSSNNFPSITGSYDTNFNGNSDAFISKFNNNLTVLLASTYIGGSNTDIGYAIINDSSNNIIIAGYTESSDFPTTPGSYDPTYNNNDVFVAKLDSNLQILFASTFMGGIMTENTYDITMDLSDNIYVAGDTSSSDFPVLVGSYNINLNGISDAYISKLDSNLSSGTGSYFTLTINNVSTDTGIVLSNPGDINCGIKCAETFTEKEVVTLLVSPYSGYIFTGWSGDADCFDGKITMDSNKTCNANFARIDSTLLDLYNLYLVSRVGKLKLPCIITIATMGTSLSKEIQILRNFRDNYLVSHQWGRMLIGLYYGFSLSTAQIIKQSKILRIITRYSIIPIIFTFKHPYCSFSIIYLFFGSLLLRQAKL